MAPKKDTNDPFASLVVDSRVRDAVKAQGDARTAGDFVEALSAKVHELIVQAVARAKSNDRSTVRPGDL